MKMKKLISLSLVSAMVASVASVSAFATQSVTGSLDNIKAFVLTDDNETLGAAQTFKQITLDGKAYDNALQINVENSHTYKLVFGLSNTCPFGKHASNLAPSNQQVYPACSDTSNAIRKGTNLLSGSTGVDIKVGTLKVNAGSTSYKYAYGVTVVGKNQTTSTRQSVYPITIKDINQQTRTFNLILISQGFDKDNTGDADADVNDEGYREFAYGTPLRNGYTIGTATLKEMYGKGSYLFVGAYGIDIVSAVSKATVDAGKTSFSADMTKDPALDSRFNANGDNMVLKVSIPFFSNESRKINVNIDNSYIMKVLGTENYEKLADGKYKKLPVYPLNDVGYNALTKASGNDGIINTDEVILATVTDGKIAFTLPKGVTDVMISAKEIDTDKLPAVPGVSIPETTSNINEVTAPIIDTTSVDTITDTTSVNEVIAPTVVSSPVLTSAPAGSGVAQNTGASDVMAIAIALAAISMAAAGVVASKKF